MFNRKFARETALRAVLIALGVLIQSVLVELDKQEPTKQLDKPAQQ